MRKLAGTTPRPPDDGKLVTPPVEPDSLPEPEEIDPLRGITPGTGEGVDGGATDGSGRGTGNIIGGFDDMAKATAPKLQPLRISEGVQGPRKVQHVAPIYPSVAVAAHIEGKVVLDCLINEEGRIIQVTVLEGNAVLAPAAEDAVRQWRYTPTLLSGVPTPVLLKVTVTFGLRR